MSSVRTRVIAVPIVIHNDRVLLCRMATGRGVFPGQWALPGGGVEPGERIDAALQREVREELGIELASSERLLFKDDVLEKTFADGSREPLHMIFLVYRCVPASLAIRLNEEFSEYVWADRALLHTLELNELTRATLASAGYLDADAERTAITSAISRFVAAYNRGDVDHLMSIYSDDLVKLRHGSDPESKRRTEDRLRIFFAENRGELTVQNDELIVSGDTAFTRGVLTIVVTPRWGERQTIRRRFVELWRKEQGQWKVARTMDAEV